VIVVYTPEGGEPEHYDANSLKVSEAAIVQRTVDMKWQQIKEGLEQDDLDAMRGIVWVLKKRTQPALRFGEFDPGVDEMTSRMDAKEVAAYVDSAFAACERDDELTPDTVAAILTERLPTIAADPDHARRLIEAKAKGPKETAEADVVVTKTADDTSSPNQTSSTPEPSISDSSPTSSTAPLLSSMS
jgi:hypothetical protein